MRIILPTELREGDIFAKEIKLHGRVAYKVLAIEIELNKVVVENRTTRTEENKQLNALGKGVYLLRREEE
jgi:uncharacterized coiled-coil protein SlyX